jgi:hypothetical protein
MPSNKKGPALGREQGSHVVEGPLNGRARGRYGRDDDHRDSSRDEAVLDGSDARFVFQEALQEVHGNCLSSQMVFDRRDRGMAALSV